MLGTIRKFSSSIYAKIFLFIVAIPFVFWGMGPLFTGGNLNTIVQIDKKKFATKEFANFINNNTSSNKVLDKSEVENLLSKFIGEKIIILESENLNIKISDEALSKLIKNEDIFKKENKFSRTEYEKFLIKNSINAVSLEANIVKQEKKNQLMDFIGGGVVPSKFLINLTYDKINQERDIQIINLNDTFSKKLSFTQNQIQSYYDKNKESYQVIFKTVKFINLNPNTLVNNNEFNDLFFERIDEIDDLIVEGNNLDFILNKLNLTAPSLATVKKSDMDHDKEKVNGLPTNLIKNVFNISESEPTILIEKNGKFYAIELINTEKIQKKINDDTVKKEILSSLQKQEKRKLTSEIIGKINNNNFNKIDFDNFSKDENASIQKIKLQKINDNKILKQNLVSQIYKYPENKVIIAADIGLAESFLVYIDKVKNVKITQNLDDYEKYFTLSKVQMTSGLYNTYDIYLKNKYKININYKALDSVINNLR